MSTRSRTRPPLITRRKFLGALGMGAVGAALHASHVSAFEFSTFDIEFKELDIRVAGLAPEFEDYRIGYATDIHLGVFVPSELFERAIFYFNNEKADLVLLGGDYLGIPDSFPARFFPVNRFPELNGIPDAAQPSFIYSRFADLTRQCRAPDGIMGVLGNHDRWVPDRAALRALFSTNFVGLINSSRRITRGSAALDLIGVDDYWTSIPRLPKLPARKGALEARVFISHNPDYVARVAADFEFDLGLCGHTHGGQIKFPLIGAPGGYNIRTSELREGLNLFTGRQVYTSRGIGVVEIPYRINCRPEVNIFRLKAA